MHDFERLATIVPTTRESANTIVINSLDPCFFKTGLPSELKDGLKVFVKVFEFLFTRTAEEGSRLVVSTASEGKTTHGKYLRAGVVQDYTLFITNAEGVSKGDKTWEQLSKKLEQLQPGILTNVKNIQFPGIEVVRDKFPC